MTIDDLADFFNSVNGFVGRSRSIEKDSDERFVSFLEGVVDVVGEDFGREIVVF